MKRVLLFGVAVAALTFTSCKKSKKNDIFDLPYSNSSVEEQKKEIEQSGINFINQVNTLPDEKSVTALTHLGELEFTDKIPAIASLEGIASASGKKNVQGVFDAATSTSSTTRKLSDNYGIYNWDASKGDWVKTPSSSRLEFKYPATDSSKTNNAVLTITYTSSNIILEDDFNDSRELPASVNAVLKVDGKEELKYTSAYEYKTDGTPTKVNMNLALGLFNFKYNLSNTSSNVTTAFSFTKSNQTLLAWEFNVNGKLSIGISGEDYPEVNNANAYFQVMNIKLAGRADFKALTKESADIEDLDGYEYDSKMSALLNKHTDLVAINTNENKIMAKAEFIADPELATRLVFKDGSKQSFDNFIEAGFENFIDEVKELQD